MPTPDVSPGQNGPVSLCGETPWPSGERSLPVTGPILQKGRTSLTVLRWGLAVIALSDVLIHFRKPGTFLSVYWLTVGIGLVMAVFGLGGLFERSGK